MQEGDWFHQRQEEGAETWTDAVGQDHGVAQAQYRWGGKGCPLQQGTPFPNDRPAGSGRDRVGFNWVESCEALVLAWMETGWTLGSLPEIERSPIRDCPIRKVTAESTDHEPARADRSETASGTLD